MTTVGGKKPKATTDTSPLFPYNVQAGYIVYNVQLNLNSNLFDFLI